MAVYRAKCWLGSNSGYQMLEVQSNTLHGAEEQLKAIYGAEQIINLHKVSANDGSNTSIGQYGGIAILVAVLWISYTFTPWIFMSVYVFSGKWISEKICGDRLGDCFNSSYHKKTTFILVSMLVLGGVGFHQGNQFQKFLQTTSNTVQMKK